MQGLELLVTVLLARNRQPPPAVAAGVPHAELAAGLVTLPSGLLAMVCEALVTLKVRLGAACVRLGCMGHSLELRVARRGPHGCTAHARVGQGQRSPLGVYAECWKHYLSYRSGCSSGFRRGPSRRRFAAHGPFAS